MTAVTASVLRWSAVGDFIAAATGLDYPVERHADLQRSLAAAARSFGMSDDADAFADWLLSGSATSAQLQDVINHLTIGETYFLRDKPAFDALSQQVLPELIGRRMTIRELRVWSAACCTGEELYTIAILLRRFLPNWNRWRLTLLGTDINEAYLKKAAAGTYAAWSFRDVPEEFKYLWFTCRKDLYEVLPQLRRGIRFAKQNLIARDYVLPGDDRPFDVILCRNALMYFRPQQALEVVAQLHRRLADDGWLLMGANEGAQYLQSGFIPVSFGNAILYKKKMTAPLADDTVERETRQESSSVIEPPPVQREHLSSLTRACANQGDLQEALSWCDRWIAVEGLNGSAHYLRGNILQELGRLGEARRAFARALYLQPSMALSDLALGNLARGEGKAREAERHFRNALATLRDMPADAVIQESDGLSVQRLREMVESLLVSQAAS